MLVLLAKHNFDAKAFLANIGEGRKIVRFQKKNRVYAQGDACDAVFYIKNYNGELEIHSSLLSVVLHDSPR